MFIAFLVVSLVSIIFAIVCHTLFFGYISLYVLIAKIILHRRNLISDKHFKFSMIFSNILKTIYFKTAFQILLIIFLVSPAGHSIWMLFSNDIFFKVIMTFCIIALLSALIITPFIFVKNKLIIWNKWHYMFYSIDAFFWSCGIFPFLWQTR